MNFNKIFELIIAIYMFILASQSIIGNISYKYFFYFLFNLIGFILIVLYHRNGSNKRLEELK